MRTNNSSNDERLKINQSSVAPPPILAPSGLTPKPRRKALPAPNRRLSKKSGKPAPQVVADTAPALSFGEKSVGNRAKGKPAPRSPGETQKRLVPMPDVPDVNDYTRSRYERALNVLAGAVGLYLHGASTLARPSVGDVENLEEMIAMIRGFGLPSVGFDAPEFGFK